MAEQGTGRELAAVKAGGALLVVVGAWICTQVLGGNALGRLGIAGQTQPQTAPGSPGGHSGFGSGGNAGGGAGGGGGGSW
jgi:hypothetical protein